MRGLSRWWLLVCSLLVLWGAASRQAKSEVIPERRVQADVVVPEQDLGVGLPIPWLKVEQKTSAAPSNVKRVKPARAAKGSKKTSHATQRASKPRILYGSGDAPALER